MPDVELRNDADFAVVLKGARIESDYAFVGAWTNDAAGKVIESGGKISVKWTAGSKLPSDWTRGKKVRVGTVTYTYERVTTDISGAEVEVSDLTYNGKELTAKVKSVTLPDGTVLKEGDYAVVSGGKATDAGEYQLAVQGKGNYTGTTTATAAWKIKEPLEVSGYWLAPAGVDDPSKYGIKTKEQIAADVKAIKAGNAAVTAEYTTYMQDDDVHLYTKWNAATGEAESAVTTGKNAYVEFRIIQVGAHDGDGSGLTFMAVHALLPPRR